LKNHDFLLRVELNQFTGIPAWITEPFEMSVVANR
jgi:hypothetical protein